MKALVGLFLGVVLSLRSFSAVAAKGSKKNLSSSPFIAAVVSSEGNIEIWLNPRAYWNSHGSLADSYTDEEQEIASAIYDSAKLCGVAESIYEACDSDTSVEQIKADLAKAGVEVLPAFQEWADKEVAE